MDRFVAVGVLIAVCCVSLSALAEELRNDSGQTAYAVEITFSKSVRIDYFGREFRTQEPRAGRSRVFTFTDGSVRSRGTFTIEWVPSSARITSIEWLATFGQQEEEDESRSICDCILAPGEDLSRRLERSYDGLVVCLEPGTYEISGLDLENDLTILGLGDVSTDVVMTPTGEWGWAYLAPVGDAEVRFENLSLEGRMWIQPEGEATAYLIGVSTSPGDDSVWQSLGVVDNSRMYIEGSVIFGHVHVSEGASLEVNTSRFGGDYYAGVVATDSGEVSLKDVEIAGRTVGCQVSDDVLLDMVDCRVEGSVGTALALGTLLDSFTGVISGSGNLIPDECFDPDAYPWPPSFRQE
ncbi:hypothetical protein ACFLSF_02305 [Candidatus Bipolaricaulota bacterium]